MAVRGRMKYVPSIVIEEIESIKKTNRIFRDNYAMMEMVKYARVGRELERIKNFDFGQPRLQDVRKPKRRK